jgi:hypothetical protein
MWGVTPPKDDERRLYEQVEVSLREFQGNIDVRLKGEGFSEWWFRPNEWVRDHRFADAVTRSSP